MRFRGTEIESRGLRTTRQYSFTRWSDHVLWELLHGWKGRSLKALSGCALNPVSLRVIRINWIKHILYRFILSGRHVNTRTYKCKEFTSEQDGNVTIETDFGCDQLRLVLMAFIMSKQLRGVLMAYFPFYCNFTISLDN
jgi:hypothetical protein